ncbi:MAG: ATP-binding protein [bacterium]|nr:ATP-binding protein [bacterium]
MGFQKKLLIFLLPLIVLSLALLGTWAGYQADQQVHQYNRDYQRVLLSSFVSERLQAYSDLLERGGLAGVHSFVDAYQQEAFKHVRQSLSRSTEFILILSQQGELVFAEDRTDVGGAQWQSAWAAVVHEALAAKPQAVHGVFETPSGHYHYRAQYFEPWDWVVVLAEDDAHIEHLIRRIHWATLGIALVTILVLFPIAFYFSRHYLVQPIQELRWAAERIARKEWTEKIDVHSKDELGSLARSIEEMSRRLKEDEQSRQQAEDKLAALNANLERTVEERVAEIKETRDQLLYQESLLRALFNAITESVSILEVDGTLEITNKTGALRLGEVPQTAAGKNVLASLPTELAERRRNLLETSFDSGQPATFIEQNEDLWLEHSVYPLGQRENGKRQVALFSQDITHRKRAEEQLIRAMKDLKEANQELSLAKDRAEEATLLKDKFISLVSHDLKNPLGNLGNLLKLIERESDPQNKTQQQLLQLGYKSITQMNDLIRELLAVERFKTGQLVPKQEPIHLRKVVEEQISRAEADLKKKQLEALVKVPKGLVVTADPALYSEVLHNLLTNAIKFSQPGQQIVFEVPEGHPNWLAVTDQGIGIPESLQEHLFCYEVTTTRPGTQGERGTGFGLPLSQDILQAMGGHLVFDPSPNQGSRFVIKLG